MLGFLLKVALTLQCCIHVASNSDEASHTSGASSSLSTARSSSVTTPVDPCQDMFAQIREEGGEEEEGATQATSNWAKVRAAVVSKKPKETPDVYKLFDLTRACSEHIIKLGQGKVTSSFQESQTSNILYMQDFANVYSTLEWLKGPHMLQAFQAGQKGAEARYKEENTLVKNDLAKMVPYTDYAPGDMPSTKEDLVALGLPEDDYVDVPHERKTNIKQPDSHGNFVAPDPENPVAGSSRTSGSHQANPQTSTAATKNYWCGGEKGSKTPIRECGTSSKGQSSGQKICQACIVGGHEGIMKMSAADAGMAPPAWEAMKEGKAANCKTEPSCE